MEASLARKCSSIRLDFYRLDYPEMDPPNWEKLIPIKLSDNKVESRESPLDYHLQEPYAPDYEENYQIHSRLKK